MNELVQRLKEKFPDFDPQKVMKKRKNKYTEEDIDYQAFDEIEVDSHKLVEAINILTGSEIELNPELKRRILQLEQRMDNIGKEQNEVTFIVRQFTKEDGDYNIKRIQDQI